MISRSVYVTTALFLMTVFFTAVPSGAMINPSALYCTELGYEYTDTVAADGAMTGFCLIPGNQTVDAWQFLEGKVSPELSYCKKQGLEVRTVSDPAVCDMLGETCAVCVRADGTTQEVTRMMGLDFREKICSGDTCCDPAKDTTCSFGMETPTGTGQNDWLPLAVIGIIALFLIAVAAYVITRKKNDAVQEKKNP